MVLERVVPTVNAEVPMGSDLQMSHPPSQNRHTNIQQHTNLMRHQDQLQFQGALTLVLKHFKQANLAHRESKRAYVTTTIVETAIIRQSGKGLTRCLQS